MPGGVLGLGDVFVLKFSFNSCYFLLMIFFVFLNDFTNRQAAVPNFSLVYQPSLDKILKAEVFVHSDSQLRAAHLILSYLQNLPGVEVYYKSQGPTSAPDQCCCSRFPYYQRSRH